MYIYIYTLKDIYYYMCVYMYFFPQILFLYFHLFAVTKARDRNTSWVLPVQKHLHRTDFSLTRWSNDSS